MRSNGALFEPFQADPIEQSFVSSFWGAKLEINKHWDTLKKVLMLFVVVGLTLQVECCLNIASWPKPFHFHNKLYKLASCNLQVGSSDARILLCDSISWIRWIVAIFNLQEQQKLVSQQKQLILSLGRPLNLMGWASKVPKRGLLKPRPGLFSSLPV